MKGNILLIFLFFFKYGSCDTASDCKPTCSPRNCIRDDKLFTPDGALLDARFNGEWKEACSSTFFISKDYVTFEEAESVCCSMGMKLLEMKTMDEQNCVEKSLVAENEDSYWTYALSDVTCSGAFSWCGSNQPLSSNSWYRWKSPGSGRMELEPWTGPREHEGCAKITINKEQEARRPHGLTSLACNETQLFICQSTTVPLKRNSTCEPTCPPRAICNKNPRLFESDGSVKEANKYGRWINACSTTFLVGSEFKNNSEAEQICCSLGMTLLEIEDRNKAKCIDQYLNLTMLNHMINIDPSYDPPIYWTYGKGDINCPEKARWCGSDSSINPDEIFIAYSFGYRGMLCMRYDNSFQASECKDRIYYICEKRSEEADVSMPGISDPENSGPTQIGGTNNPPPKTTAKKSRPAKPRRKNHKNVKNKKPTNRNSRNGNAKKAKPKNSNTWNGNAKNGKPKKNVAVTV